VAAGAGAGAADAGGVLATVEVTALLAALLAALLTLGLVEELVLGVGLVIWPYFGESKSLSKVLGGV